VTRAEHRLYDWLYHHKRDHFWIKFFDLLTKADPDTLEQFAEGFPEEVRVLKLYRTIAGRDMLAKFEQYHEMIHG
jgi:hypothetical protein